MTEKCNGKHKYAAVACVKCHQKKLNGCKKQVTSGWKSDQGDKPNDVRTLPVRFLTGAKYHAIRCVEPANTKPKAKLFSLRTSSRYRGLTQWCPHPPVITGDSFRYSDTSFPHQVILTWCVTFSYFTFWSSGEFVPDLLQEYI